jgi:hypothetical protein
MEILFLQVVSNATVLTFLLIVILCYRYFIFKITNENNGLLEMRWWTLKNQNLCIMGGWGGCGHLFLGWYKIQIQNKTKNVEFFNEWINIECLPNKLDFKTSSLVTSQNFFLTFWCIEMAFWKMLFYNFYHLFYKCLKKILIFLFFSLIFDVQAGNFLIFSLFRVFFIWFQL